MAETEGGNFAPFLRSLLLCLGPSGPHVLAKREITGKLHMLLHISLQYIYTYLMIQHLAKLRKDNGAL